MILEVGSKLKFTNDFNKWFIERYSCSPEAYYGKAPLIVEEVVEVDEMKEIYFAVEGSLECIFLNGDNKFCVFSSRGGLGESPCEAFEEY